MKDNNMSSVIGFDMAEEEIIISVKNMKNISLIRNVHPRPVQHFVNMLSILSSVRDVVSVLRTVRLTLSPVL